MKIVISGTHCIHWNTILTHPPRYSMLLEASKRSKMHKIILHENLHAGSDSIAVKAIFSGYCRDQCCLQDGVFPLKKEHTSSSTTLRLYDGRLRILHIQQSVTGKEWLTNDILVQSVGHCDASNHRATFLAIVPTLNNALALQLYGWTKMLSPVPLGWGNLWKQMEPIFNEHLSHSGQYPCQQYPLKFALNAVVSGPALAFCWKKILTHLGQFWGTQKHGKSWKKVQMMFSWIQRVLEITFFMISMNFNITWKCGGNSNNISWKKGCSHTFRG